MEEARAYAPTVDATAPTSLRSLTLGAVPASHSTPLLRRCTSLATRARVDLMMTSRRADIAKLAEVLGDVAAWETAVLVDPDRTMVALAAASLQDLQERLDEAGQIALGSAIDRALAVLHAALERKAA